MMDTNIGSVKKDDAATVAEIGLKAMMNGKGDVVSGWEKQTTDRDRLRDAGRRAGGDAPGLGGVGQRQGISDTP